MSRDISFVVAALVWAKPFFVYAGAAAAPPVATGRVVVMAGPQSVDAARDIQVFVAERVRAGGTAWPSEAAFEAATGTPKPKIFTAEELSALRAAGDAAERHWQLEAIVAARQAMIAAYDRTLRPDATLRAFAAYAYHAMATAHGAEGNDGQVDGIMREAARRFPQQAPDHVMFAPKYGMAFDEQKTALARGARGTLRVRINRPASVWVDGLALATKVTDTGSRALPVGRYRVWAELETGQMSLPHAVEVKANAAAEVSIDAVLEPCIEPGPPARLTCTIDDPEARAAHLAKLSAWLGVDAVVIAPAAPSLTAEPLGAQIASNASTTVTLDTTLAKAPMPVFSPLYLLPFGGAQIYQGTYDTKRFAFGAAYLATEVGLGVWQVVARLQFDEALRQRRNASLADIDMQITASAVALVSVLVATLLEGVIWGAVAGE